MTKSITIELQDWANWVAQDLDGDIWQYEKEPVEFDRCFNAENDVETIDRIFERLRKNPNWQNSKINLNTHSAYIDAEGILQRREL